MARPVGIGLMVINAFVVIPVVWIGFGIAVVLLSQVGEGDDPFTFVPEHVRPTLAWVWVASAAIFVTFRWVGRRLSRLNRYRILYLRRFGDTDSTHVVTRAARRLGGDWRSVTLDDGKVRSVDASTGARATYAVTNATGHIANVFIWMFKYIVLPLAGLALVLTILGPGVKLAQSYFAIGDLFMFVLVCGAALAPGVLALYGVVRPPSGSAGQRRFVVHNDGDLLAARRAMATAADATFGPHLAIVDVKASDDLLWRRTVRSFARDCDLTLIDVSQPTENVLWEIEQLTRREVMPTVLVAERSRLDALAHAQTDDIARLRELIAGRTVLTYSTDRRSAGRFVSALRSSFMHGVGSEPDRSRRVSSPRWLSARESRRQLGLWVFAITFGVLFAVGMATLSSCIRAVNPGLSHVGATFTDAASGALVVEVEQGGPAEQAGIRPGDVVVQIGDKLIRTARDAGWAVLAHEPGQTVPVIVERDGVDIVLRVTLVGDRALPPPPGRTESVLSRRHRNRNLHTVTGIDRSRVVALRW